MAITRKQKAGQTVGGGLAGAATGAALGSIVPGIGTLIGAGLGGLLGGGGSYLAGDETRENLTKQAKKAAIKQQKMAGKQPNGAAAGPSQLGSTAVGPKGLKEQLFGTDDRVQQFANRTPEQMAAQNQLLQLAMQQLQGNKFDFAPIQQEATQNFQRQTIPSIMERYKGGALNRALASAGKDLDTGLASLKSQHALGQQGLNLQQLGLGLAPQFENAFINGQEGFLDPFKNLLKDPASYAALLSKLKEAYQSRQAGQANGNVGGEQVGEFGGNPDLAAFANQGSGYNINQYLNQLNSGQTPTSLNKNLTGMGITNPTTSYQQLNPVQRTNFSGQPFIMPQNKNLDALKALYPTIK